MKKSIPFLPWGEKRKKEKKHQHWSVRGRKKAVFFLHPTPGHSVVLEESMFVHLPSRLLTLMLAGRFLNHIVDFSLCSHHVLCSPMALWGINVGVARCGKSPPSTRLGSLSYLTPLNSPNSSLLQQLYLQTFFSLLSTIDPSRLQDETFVVWVLEANLMHALSLPANLEWWESYREHVRPRVLLQFPLILASIFPTLMSAEASREGQWCRWQVQDPRTHFSRMGHPRAHGGGRTDSTESAEANSNRTSACTTEPLPAMDPTSKAQCFHVESAGLEGSMQWSSKSPGSEIQF